MSEVYIKSFPGSNHVITENLNLVGIFGGNLFRIIYLKGDVFRIFFLIGDFIQVNRFFILS